LIVGKGVCVPAFFFQNNFPKPEQSNYHLWLILTNALNVGLMPVDLTEVGGKALRSEARKYVLFEFC
jgi:hypothetical protein